MKSPKIDELRKCLGGRADEASADALNALDFVDDLSIHDTGPIGRSSVVDIYTGRAKLAERMGTTKGNYNESLIALKASKAAEITIQGFDQGKRSFFLFLNSNDCDLIAVLCIEPTQK